MAIQQAAAAAGISYAIEYITGYNPTILRSAIAGACGAADYYAKTNLVASIQSATQSESPMVGPIAGAAAGGLLYGALNSYTGTSSLTSGFLRGAFYAFSSDMLLQYTSKSFGSEKWRKNLIARIKANEEKIKSTPAESKPPPSL